MIDFILDVIAVSAPIIGAIAGIAGIIRLAVSVKNVFHDLRMADEKFTLKIDRLNAKSDRVVDELHRYISISTSRLEAFENRLLNLEAREK